MGTLIDASDSSATVVRFPRRLHYDVQRLARADDITQNDLIIKMIEREVSKAKNIEWIEDYIKKATYLWEIDVKELKEKLQKKMPLSVDQKAHLAHVLPVKKREKLFLDTWPNDLDEIALIDELLDRSTELRKNRKYYNTRKLANNLKIELTEFGKAYLKGFLKDKDFDKVMEETDSFFIEKESEEIESSVVEEPPSESVEASEIPEVEAEETPTDDEPLEAEFLEPEEG